MDATNSLINWEYVDLSRPARRFASLAEAAQYAESAYWVEPVELEDEDADWGFSIMFRVTDASQSGMLHYERTRTRVGG